MTWLKLANFSGNLNFYSFCVTDAEQMSPSKSFIFSPPLTRGLSKRLSLEPGDQTSISRRLSLNSDSLTAISSRPAQRRLSHESTTQGANSILLPPPASPSLIVTPRPSIRRRGKDTDKVGYMDVHVYPFQARCVYETQMPQAATMVNKSKIS